MSEFVDAETRIIRELAETVRECKAQRKQIRQLEAQRDQWKVEAKWAAAYLVLLRDYTTSDIREQAHRILKGEL